MDAFSGALGGPTTSLAPSTIPGFVGAIPGTVEQAVSTGGGDE